jgi:GNAT superfamily N-acetyltransferase
MTLRRAGVNDAAEIARLATELGYPTSSEVMRARLNTLLVHPDHRISVVDDGSKLLGWIAVERRRTLESGERVEIVGLVVDADHRIGGVGRTLVADAEQWARESGLDAMQVRSNIAREASHHFYERLGYVRRKTQHVYIKTLAST